jgi:hypothetical protein
VSNCDGWSRLDSGERWQVLAAKVRDTRPTRVRDLHEIERIGLEREALTTLAVLWESTTAPAPAAARR